VPLPLKLNLQSTPALLKRTPDKVLFYQFYNMPLDRQQVEAAQELSTRGWKYKKSTMRWYRKEANNEKVAFDPDRWEVVLAEYS
jgi:CCR4-NOT transcriptional regulation complex NOT5 subunit